METAINVISDLLREHPIVSFASPTGSGKTVTIPLSLNKMGWNRIIHIQPRNVAVESIVKYMMYVNETLFRKSEQLTFGSSLRSTGLVFDINADINYITPGFFNDLVMSRYELQGDDFMQVCDLIIIDEASDSSVEYALMMSLIGFAKENDYLMPSVLLMSASTMRGNYEIDRLDPHEYNYPSVSYEVSVFYTNLRGSEPENVKKVIERVFKDNDLSGSHSILVFLPTKSMINKLANILPATIDGLSLDIIKVSSSELPDQDTINKYIPGNTVRMYLSTNVMEQSVTVKWLSVVIDTMLELEPTANLHDRLRTDSTSMRSITKSSALQRKGRTGREYKGLCYRMISKKGYEGLEPIKQSVIHNIYLESLIIKAVMHKFSPIDLFVTVDHDRLIDSIEWLIDNRFFEYDDETGFLIPTDIARFTLDTQIHPAVSRLLFSSLSYGLISKTQDRQSGKVIDLVDVDRPSINKLHIMIVCVIDTVNTTNKEKITQYTQRLRNHYKQMKQIVAPETDSQGLSIEMMIQITDKIKTVLVNLVERGYQIEKDEIGEIEYHQTLANLIAEANK